MPETHVGHFLSQPEKKKKKKKSIPRQKKTLPQADQDEHGQLDLKPVGEAPAG